MAQLPTQKRITPESFPDQEDWIPKLLEPLNKFMEEVTRALNNQITVNENLDAVVKTVQLDGVYPVKFRWERKNRPKAAWIGQCREISENHTTITTALYLDWEYTQDGMFQINNVAGLSTATPSNKFNLTVIAIAG